MRAHIKHKDTKAQRHKEVYFFLVSLRLRVFVLNSLKIEGVHCNEA